MAASKHSNSSACSGSSSSRPSTSGAEAPPLPSSGFFIPNDQSSAEGGSSDAHAPRDPFKTPDASIPSTPKPSSVVSFSGFLDTHPAYRRHDSRISVHSAHRKSHGDIQEVQSSASLSSPSSRSHRNSFMPPLPMRRSSALHGSTQASRMSVMSRGKKPMRSTMLTSKIEKPWLTDKDSRMTLAYWIVYAVAFLGIAGGAVRCYFTWAQTLHLGNLCLVMEDNFDTFDTQNTWTQEVSMSGFGNQEFEMTTSSRNNSFVRDGHLYIVPTLTSDVIGRAAVLGSPPYTFNLTGCNDGNATNCGAVSNASARAVIPPVMSARIHTKGHYAIRYGRVEISAKLPRGDWLWPALWMLPVDDAYGAWPRSGEIDIMEARGNGPEYQAQGVDYVRGSLNWGPFSWLNGVSKTYGWWTNRRKTFADGFHSFVLEWDAEFVRVYVDSRLTYMLYLKFDEPFFRRGDFPSVVANGTGFIQLEDPWRNGTRNVAPFDQPFYLIMNVAVGGTNGWFPDGVGDKPWLDGSQTAMTDFANAQDQWYTTWPTNIEDRALVVDSVKMWQQC